MTSLQSPLETADAGVEVRIPAAAKSAEGSKARRLQRLSVGLMALALAASPAYVLRPHRGPIPTTVLELLLLPALALGLYAFRGELPWLSPFLLPALLLLVAAALDTIFAPDRRAAVGLLKAYFAEPMLIGLVVAAMARDRRRALVLLGGLGVAGGFVAIVNIAVAVRALLTHSFNLVTPPVAVYTSANSVPLYLEPLVAFALPLAFLAAGRRLRVLAAAFAAVSALAIGLSFSRAGWLTLIALVIMAALFTPRRWVLIGAVATLAAVIFAASSRVRHRILVELNPASAENTVVLRLSLWKSAFNMLRHQPILGSGLAGFQTSVPPYVDPAYHEDQIYPHNLLLNFWSETGLLGLAAFLWLMAQTVRVDIEGLRLGGWPRLMAIGGLGMVLSLFVHGLVDIPYFKNDQALLFWALLGVQLGSLREGRAGVT
jgi:O-antigen ligase